MNPVLLLLAGGGLILASRKKKRKRSASKPVLTSLGLAPVRVSPPTREVTLLPGVKLHKMNFSKIARESIEKQKSGVPLFDGFPTGIVPDRYKAINMSAYTSGGSGTKAGYGPHPARFVQWGRLMESDAFMKKYAFGVVDGGGLEFYVIGKSVAKSKCCEVVRCRKETTGPSTKNQASAAWGESGPVEQYAKKLGAGWNCNCEKTPSECFDLIERPLVNWPLAQTEPP